MLDTTKITNQFNSGAKAYDSKRRAFIPCFDDYYINATKFIADVINEPKRVLDLGAGTGLLTSFWYEEFPRANYVLDDISIEMLNMAKARFRDASNVDYVTDNYRQPLKTQGVWHSAQMMSDFRQKSADILYVFQGFLTTKTALVGHYDECRDVFRGCL